MTRTERIAQNHAHIAAVRALLEASRLNLRRKIRPHVRVRLVRIGAEMNWNVRYVPELGSEVTIQDTQWTVVATVRSVPGEVRTLARGMG